MKTNILFNTSKRLLSSLLLVSLVAMMSCGEEDPAKEDTPELITKVTLTFVPTGEQTGPSFLATDPDGEGVQNITVSGPIQLSPNKEYTLYILLINELAISGAPNF